MVFSKHKPTPRKKKPDISLTDFVVVVGVFSLVVEDISLTDFVVVVVMGVPFM